MVPRELGFDLACDPGAGRAFPVVRAGGEGLAGESACATSVCSGAPTGVGICIIGQRVHCACGTNELLVFEFGLEDAPVLENHSARSRSLTVLYAA